MNKFLFMFLQYKKFTNIQITYSLITQAGKEIYSLTQNMKPLKLSVFKYSDFRWNDYMDYIEKDEDYKTFFDNEAAILLNKFQRRGRKKIKRGWLDSGLYIVKCVWKVWPEMDYADYDEYVEFNSKNEKNNRHA